MDLKTAFSLFMRHFGNRLLNGMVKSGIDYAAGGGKSAKKMGAAERRQAQAGHALVKRAKKMRNITRRFF